ncbi:hypothetical protein DV515_00002663, partial [Chloebia gouldiae]
RRCGPAERRGESGGTRAGQRNPSRAAEPGRPPCPAPPCPALPCPALSRHTGSWAAAGRASLASAGREEEAALRLRPGCCKDGSPGSSR